MARRRPRQGVRLNRPGRASVPGAGAIRDAARDDHAGDWPVGRHHVPRRRDGRPLPLSSISIVASRARVVQNASRISLSTPRRDPTRAEMRLVTVTL